MCGDQLCYLIKVILRILALIFNGSLLLYFIYFYNPEPVGIMWVLYAVAHIVLFEMLLDSQKREDRRFKPLLG